MIPLLRWPTLERRTHRHVALMKELPDGVGKRFREAVEEELRELGHRSEQRLTRNARILEFSVRVGIIAGFWVIAVVAFDRVIESDDVWSAIGRGALILLGIFVVLVLLSLLWRAAGSGYERDRLWRRAQDEGKHLVLAEHGWRVM